MRICLYIRTPKNWKSKTKFTDKQKKILNSYFDKDPYFTSYHQLVSTASQEANITPKQVCMKVVYPWDSSPMMMTFCLLFYVGERLGSQQKTRM